MTLLDLAHSLMLKHQSRLGEQSAECRARRRLLALARAQSWPSVQLLSLSGSPNVSGGRVAWERCVREWQPATVVSVLHALYVGIAAREHMPQILPGMWIADVNGERIGRVTGLALTPDTGMPARITMRRGRFALRQIELPLTWIRELDGSGVLLNVPKHSIEHLGAHA